MAICHFVQKDNVIHDNQILRESFPEPQSGDNVQACIVVQLQVHLQHGNFTPILCRERTLVVAPLL